MKRLLGLLIGLLSTVGLVGLAHAQCSQTWISSGLKAEQQDKNGRDLTQPPYNYILVNSAGGGTFRTTLTVTTTPSPSSLAQVWVAQTPMPAGTPAYTQLPGSAFAPAGFPAPGTYTLTLTVPSSLSTYVGQPYFYFHVYMSYGTCTILNNATSL